MLAIKTSFQRPLEDLNIKFLIHEQQASQEMDNILSFAVTDIAYEIRPDEEQIMQQITIINDSPISWPTDTRLQLGDCQTDLKMREDIFIGAVASGDSCRISINMDLYLTCPRQI